MQRGSITRIQIGLICPSAPVALQAPLNPKHYTRNPKPNPFTPNSIPKTLNPTPIGTHPERSSPRSQASRSSVFTPALPRKHAHQAQGCLLYPEKCGPYKPSNTDSITHRTKATGSLEWLSRACPRDPRLRGAACSPLPSPQNTLIRESSSTLENPACLTVPTDL